jgi:hypothetical protein
LHRAAGIEFEQSADSPNKNLDQGGGAARKLAKDEGRGAWPCTHKSDIGALPPNIRFSRMATMQQACPTGPSWVIHVVLGVRQ